MFNNQRLARTAEKLVRQLHENTIEHQVRSIEEVFPIMEGMQQLFPQWALVTCIAHHADCRFVTPNALQIFGYSAEVLKQISLGGFFNYVYEDDRDDLTQCLNFLYDFFKDKTSEEYLAHRTVLHYRFRHRDQRVILLHDEKAALRMQNGNAVYYTLFKDITDEAPFTGVKLEILTEKTLQKVAEFQPSTHNLHLSKRETELVGLIKHGLTTKEIAHRLNISHHTVRNIRQKMFEKFNVNNSIELLNKALAF